MSSGRRAGSRRQPGTDATRSRCATVVLVLALGLTCPAAAMAGLGEPYRPPVAAAGTTGTPPRQQPARAFEVHETLAGDGSQLRQYVSPAGVVFAATWTGPALPDLKLILGPHHAVFAAALAAGTGSQKVFAMATDDMVLQLVKLPRGFAGAAHVPWLLPPGTRPEDIR